MLDANEIISSLAWLYLVSKTTFWIVDKEEEGKLTMQWQQELYQLLPEC